MTSALGPANDRRRRRTQAALLTAAAELFARKGFRQTSVDELAETADVALSSIYSNFPGGKADVYAALACQVADLHVEEMKPALEAKSQTAIFDEYCRFHRDNPMAFRLLGLVDIEPSDTEFYDEARTRIKGRLAGLIDEASTALGAGSRGELIQMWASINGLLSLHAQGFISGDELGELLVRLRDSEGKR